MAPDRALVLVCNSHIDPVWLWPWEEGLAATIATFRSAADLCDEFPSFVFCHNEALLYRWVEEHDPALFDRIRRLVGEGRWHVMGGWFLQPDCNLPSGESLVRQVLVGKRYFIQRFGVEPRVAVNLDPFGHARGLVQVLRKSGYDGYLFCRPDAGWLTLPADDFLWVGHDGSTIAAHRAREHYNSERGRAREKIERWLGAYPDRRRGLLLWGVGNHGGGPSREDLRAIASLQAETPGRAVRHGTPEDHFDAVAAGPALPRFEQDLNPWAVGCYTSMATVKRTHGRLERGYYAAEAMAATASLQHLFPYPQTDFAAALEDLLYCQFHDILPGEGVREVERQALDRLGHGLEIVGRVRARAFVALLSGQAPAADGDFPLFVYNHHPFEVCGTIECEFQPPEPNADRTTFWLPEITDSAGASVASQLEKESCNIRNDQRKRVVFEARLAPSSATRFGCRLREVPQPRPPAVGAVTAPFVHRFDTAGDPGAPGGSSRSEVEIDHATGLLTRYRVDGVDYLSGPAARPLLVRDSADPWGMKVRGFRDVVGAFALMSPADAAAFAGVAAPELAPVRVIESGNVRTVVEALFGLERSAMAIRYTLPERGTEIGIDVTVSWFETDRMLKLSWPTAFAGGQVLRQTAYGVDPLPREGEEAVVHRWLAVVAPGGRHAITLVNDCTHGFDFADGELRVSLLRAPAYAGHPVDDVTPIVRQDRYEPRVDQGVHTFRFWLRGGPASERLSAVDRESAVRTDGLMALSFFPSGHGRPAIPGIVIEDDAVRLGALKMSEDGERLVVRLFEPTGRARRTAVRLPPIGLAFDVELGPFEIKTLVVDPGSRTVVEADLLERGRSAQ
jgi:alpha-mannosidase